MFSHKSSNVTDDSSASLAQRERIDGSEICTQGMLLIIYTQYEKINVMIQEIMSVTFQTLVLLKAKKSKQYSKYLFFQLMIPSQMKDIKKYNTKASIFQRHQCALFFKILFPLPHSRRRAHNLYNSLESKLQSPRFWLHNQCPYFYS